MTASNLLEELTWPEAKEKIHACPIALLPIGSTEQHGPHLPLSTDAFDAYWVAKEAVARVREPRPLVCPPVNYGVSAHHMRFPGTITLSAATLTQVVYEICISLVTHGIRKIIIINGHGGNRTALAIAARKVKQETGMFVCIETGELGARARKELFRSKNDVHAGEYETSTSLSNRGDLVRRELIRTKNDYYQNLKEMPHSFWFEGDAIVPSAWMTHEYSSIGVLGNPRNASKEKGDRYWKAYIKNLVRLIEDVKKMEPIGS